MRISHPGRSKTQEVPSVYLWREGLPIQGPALWPGLAPRTFTKCMDAALAPLRLQGIRVLNYLDDWLILAHSRELVSRHRDIVLGHIHSLGLRMNAKEECAPPISANCVSRSSFGFRSDAGLFGSCPDTSSYSMSGPLQARPSCLCRYLPQAVGPHGSSLPCVAPRAASHEAIPLVDEGAEVTPHCTSYSPYQGVAQLLSTPFNVARPRLSPERGENGCDPPLPYDRDGRINDRLGCGLQRQTCERRVEGWVSLLAYKLPGTQGCLPVFYKVFSPRSRGVSYHSQDGQYGGCVPHKPPRRFKVAHSFGPKTSSSLWGRFTFREYWTWRTIFCRDRSSGRGNGCWTVRRYPRSGICLAKRRWTSLLLKSHEFWFWLCPLWFSLSFPTTLGIDAFAHPWPNVSLYAFPPIKLIPAVLCRVKVSGARLLLVAPFWPSQTWFSELTLLLYRPPWEILIRRD